MKIEENEMKISKKSQMRLEKIVIVLGISLAVISCCSYFVIDAFAQQDFLLDCPKNAYHGIDNNGNETCRDIISNQIVDVESVIVIDSDSEKIIESDYQNIIVPETKEVIVNSEQTPVVEIPILIMIIIVGSIIGILGKKKKLKIFQRAGWSSIQKEHVRNRQYDKCSMCFTQPSQWKYDYFDGNKNNTKLDNCQGLCSDCFSVKTKRDNSFNIYHESN